MEPAAPRRAPWRFVPALYVLQGMPYFAVQAASNTFLTAMGGSPAAVGAWSSDLTLPWMLKPLWSPLVDLYGTKRRWLFAAAFAVLVAFGAIAATMASAPPEVAPFGPGELPAFALRVVWACLALAVASATYDVACDGYYILALEKRDQEAFVGVRNACYRFGRILVTGGAVALAGYLHSGSLALPRGTAWAVAFAVGGVAYAGGLVLVAWQAPKPANDGPASRRGESAPLAAMLAEYVRTPRLAAVLAFVVFYRAAESMLTPMISPFLLRSSEQGGMGLSEAAVGLAYGTIGVSALLVGGLCGGWLVSRIGLRRSLWPMALAMHAPNVLYAWAASARPGPATLSVVVGVEQLGYGFGFAAYMVFLLQLSRGSRFATTHYAISTGLMGLSAWLAGRWSGHLAEALGFEHFFWLVSAIGFASLATLVFVPDLERRAASA